MSAAARATAAVMTTLLLMRRDIQHGQSCLHKVLQGNLVENISGSCLKEEKYEVIFCKNKMKPVFFGLFNFLYCDIIL